MLESGPIDDWVPRGIGDSVFATNLSKKKFGDAELKHKVRDEIIAVEAHGGRLTGRYVEDHLFTMRAVLEARRAELEDRVPVARWSVEVVFVAHQIDAVYLIRCWFQTFPFGCHIEHFLISNRWLLSRASLT